MYPIKKLLESKLIKNSIISAVLSFIIGTLLFALFYSTEYILFAVLGFIFLILAVLTNTVFMIGNFAMVFKSPLKERAHIITIGILMLNIPVALFYSKIAINIIMNQVAID